MQWLVGRLLRAGGSYCTLGGAFMKESVIEKILERAICLLVKCLL